MDRPDRAERARRQQLAAERRDREEQDRLDAEGREQVLAAEAERRDFDQHVQEDQARAAAAYDAAAVKALDQVAQLIAACEEHHDDVVALDELREILREAGHPDFLRDAGWCGTGE